MASGDSVGSRETSENCIPSLLGGSEESYAFECDACKLDGNVKEALFYCCDCEDSLCRECESFHKRVKVTRSHEIVSRDEIPQKSHSKEAVTEIKLTQNIGNLCACNQLQDVKFYCAGHNAVFCSICKHVHHSNCATNTIDKSCEAESFSDEFQATLKKVHTLIGKAAEFEKKKTIASNTLEQMERNCREEIKETRKQVNLLFEKLEEKSLEDLKSMVNDQSVILMDGDAKFKSTLHLLNTDKKNVEEAQNTRDRRQMFIIHTKISKTLHIYESVLVGCHDKLISPSLAFERHNVVADLHQKLDSLGTIISSPTPSTVKINIFDMDVKSRLVVDVKIASDSEKPWITGIAFLPNDQLLIADYNNRYLILYDTKSMSRKASIKCANRPWDIATTSMNEAVVTFPNEKEIRFLQIGNDLQFGYTITLKHMAKLKGITVKHGLIYAACYRGDDVVQVLDREGNVRRTIKHIEIGNANLSNSFRYYITASHKKNRIYLPSESTVICITTDGKFISTHTSPVMYSPRGLLVDDQDNILVCCHGSHNVHVFSPDGTKHKVLLTSKYQISKPYSIDYIANDDTLAIGDWESGHLHILKLTQMLL